MEFAICLLLLVVLAFATMEVGRLLYHQEIITKGVRDAARYLSRVPMTCSDANSFTFTTEPYKTNAENLVLTGSTDSSMPVLSEDYNNSPSISIDVTCIDNSGNDYYGPKFLPVFRVTAQVQFSGILLDVLRALAGNSDTGPLTYSISHQEVSIGE